MRKKSKLYVIQGYSTFCITPRYTQCVAVMFPRNKYDDDEWVREICLKIFYIYTPKADGAAKFSFHVALFVFFANITCPFSGKGEIIETTTNVRKITRERRRGRKEVFWGQTSLASLCFLGHTKYTFRDRRRYCSNKNNIV